MAFDIKAFLQTAIPAGIGVAGAIAGKKAQSAGNIQSRQAIDAAYREALGAYNTAHGRATDINNWMLQSSFAPLNFGYGQSRADLTNALMMGQQGLSGGQSAIADILGPYTSAGRRGAEETNFLLYGQRPGAGSPGAPPGAPAVPSTPSAGGFQLPADFGGGFNITPPPGSGGGPSAPGGGVPNALTSFAPNLADNRVRPSGAAGVVGTGAGIAGSLIPGVGPMVGSTAGALAGGLISRLTRKGREKEAASGAVNEHSDWFWNEVVPTAQREGWSGEQLKQTADSGWNDYSNWVGSNIKDKGVAASSLASQKKSFDEGLKSNPYTSQYYK